MRACISPVVDTDELATTFLDEHKLTKQGLYVEHKEGPDNRKPVCVCVCARAVIKSKLGSLHKFVTLSKNHLTITYRRHKPWIRKRLKSGVNILHHIDSGSVVAKHLSVWQRIVCSQEKEAVL